MTIGLLLNTCEPFYRGGYERRAWTLARECARQGHDVRIYTSCPREEEIEGVRFVPLAPVRRFFNARGVRNGLADILFAGAVLRLLERLKPGELDVLDVCATPFLHLPSVAFVARIKRLPVVLTCHEALLAELPDYVRERGETGTWRGRFLVWVLAGIYRTTTALFDNRLAVSKRTAQALKEEHLPARATVEFGLEPEAFAAVMPMSIRRKEEPVRLVYCGRLTPIKGVDRTLSALAELSENTRPFHFSVIGGGGERTRLERLVAARGLESCVTFLGEVSEVQKRAVLAESEVFVLSSPREGFSIGTLEAMAQGCAALVVSDPGRPNGVLDFVRHEREGLVVGPGMHGLRKGLQRLLENEEERQTYREAAWEAARHYRVEAQAARLLEFYAGSR